jgi:hypothetical protein
MTNQLPKNIQISENVLFQQISGECVLLNMESEQYFGLDEVGARIWELLSEDGDTEKAIQKLLAEYEIDEVTLRKDVSNLLEELEGEQLIHYITGIK